MSRKEVFDAVQAALLNSECDPKDAVIAALEAVALFADGEDIADLPGMMNRIVENT